jgi:hypothetical protein
MKPYLLRYQSSSLSHFEEILVTINYIFPSLLKQNLLSIMLLLRWEKIITIQISYFALLLPIGITGGHRAASLWVGFYLLDSESQVCCLLECGPTYWKPSLLVATLISWGFKMHMTQAVKNQHKTIFKEWIDIKHKHQEGYIVT